MGFREILSEMVDSVEGGYAGTLVGFDGIPVDQYITEGQNCDVESVAVEYGRIMEEIMKSSDMLKLGEVEDVAIVSHGSKILLRLVSAEYFLAFVLSGSGSTGKARYYLSKASRKTATELSK